MRISKFFSGLFALIGIAIGAGAVFLCLNSLDREPVLLKAPDTAAVRVDALFQAVCDNDYAAASALIYGSPALDAVQEEEDPVSALIWEAFVDSLGYQLQGECYASGSGVAQDVAISYLDIASVTQGLQERSRDLLMQRISEAEDMEEIYDENNEYRQDFVADVVTDAAKTALSKDARYVETALTVNLVYAQGQWWILADDALMQVISGGMVS